MKKLIVTGGGFAVAKISRRLENYFEVTLIDEKEYFEFTPGILRSITNPKHLKKIQINHKDYLKKSKFVLGKVSKIWEDYIFVNKEGIKYDYLVICSGSRYESPIKDRDIVIASRGRNLAKYTNKLSKAKNIIIIGGGLVGIELAGEILSRYNNKNIRIIHSNERIIYRNNIKSCIYAERFLKKNNVGIICCEKVIRKERSELITNKNNNFKYDIAFFCTGIKPNSDFIDKKYLDSNGFIKVDKYLRMKNNVFACGDAAAVHEEKTAQASEIQASIVIKNLIALEGNKELKEYPSKERPFSISLGLYDGIFEYKNFVITGIIPSLIKRFIEYKTMIKYRLRI